ncbi:hypothetical protein [Streptomyces chilikensis]|uniref:Uncharacterized protein n=1 Tax=Streptomyces chilikensis TaxID=1194079 RepID=A0ABV3EP72_9ACTN
MSDTPPGPAVEETGVTQAAAAAEAAAAEDPAAPAPLGVPRTPTGDAGVDAALDRLADADHLAADGHLEVYEDVHRALREALTALDNPVAPTPHDNRS